MKKAVKEKVREDLKKEKNNTELWLESDLSLGQAIINWKEKWKETRLKAENYINKEFYPLDERSIKRKTRKAYINKVNKWIENFIRGYIQQLKARKFNAEEE
jgi:fructose-1,6-bisphosphatase/inositol monophosphatase family enzyme